MTYKIKNDRDKRLIARTFLFQYCQKNFGLADYTFEYIKSDRPIFKSSDIKFNISYSKNLIALAISKRSDISIDIEYIDTNVNADEFATFFMNSEQLIFFKHIHPTKRYDYFYSIWTYKEARVKLSGEGMYRDFKTITTEHNSIAKEQNIDFNGNKYIYTICYI